MRYKYENEMTKSLEAVTHTHTHVYFYKIGKRRVLPLFAMEILNKKAYQ